MSIGLAGVLILSGCSGTSVEVEDVEKEEPKPEAILVIEEPEIEEVVEEIIVKEPEIIVNETEVIVKEPTEPTEPPVVEEPVEVVNGETMVFTATAYCNCSKCCGKWAGGNTASGTVPTAGRTIAVDTSVIPFGTKVIINGTTYIAEDTGSLIEGNRIDIFFNSHEEALQFGVQQLEGVVIW